MIFHKVNLDLTDSQLNNLIKKKAINIKHSQLGQGVHIIHLHDLNMKNIDKAHKNTKGVRIKLNDEEHEKNMEEGEGIGRFFRNLGRKIKSIAKPVLKYSIDNAPELADLGLDLSRGAGIKNNDNNIMAFKKGSLEAKQHMAKIRAMKKGKGIGAGIGSGIGSGMEGEGLFSALHKIGISKGKIQKGLKKELKNAVHKGIDFGTDFLKNAVKNTTGNDKLADSLGNTLNHASHSIIEGKNPIGKIKHDMKKIGKDALKGYHPSEEMSAVEAPSIEEGGRIRRRRKQKVGCGISGISPLYDQTMGINYGVHPMSGGSIHHGPHYSIMSPHPDTFSPYANISSAQFHPFVPTFNNFSPYLAYGHYHGRGNGLFWPIITFNRIFC
jgi:hypothetical protein